MLRLKLIVFLMFALPVACFCAEAELCIESIAYSGDENAIIVEIKNRGNSDAYIIDCFDLKFSVVTIKIVDPESKVVAIDHPSSDWGAKPSDRFLLLAGEVLKRSIKLPQNTLGDKKYRISVKYEVERNSFFLFPFLDRELKTNKNFIWFGSIEKESEIQVPKKK